MTKKEKGIPPIADEEKGFIPQMGGVLISKNTSIPIGKGGSLGSKEDAWSDFPKGWTYDSKSKFYKSMGQEECGEDHEEDGPTSTCIDKINGHVDDPGAFCASLRDKVTGTTKWRGKGK